MRVGRDAAGAGLSQARRTVQFGGSLVAPGGVAGFVRAKSGVEVMRIETARVGGTGRLLRMGFSDSDSDPAGKSDPGAAAVLARARALLQLVASRACSPGLARAVFESVDIHLRMPPEPVPVFPRDADLALFLALASLFSDRAVPAGLVAAARVNAQGRLLPACDAQQCIRAAACAGFGVLLLPTAGGAMTEPERLSGGVRCLRVGTVDEALQQLGCATVSR